MGSDGCGSIAIVIDRKCNIRCAHCCFTSGPHSEEHLTDETILQIVHEAIANPSIHTVGFSGGEALLRKPILIESLKLLSNAGMTSSITTNGFWGQTFARASSEVKELHEAGLSILTISYDAFHAAFIPAQRIKNVLDACRENHVQAHLNVAVTRSAGASSIIESLGDSVLGVPVSIFPIEPVGRGAAIPDSEVIRLESNPDTLRCPGFDPTFLYDGNVYPCCSPAVFGTSLVLGQRNRVTVDKAVDRIQRNAFLAYIRHEGFGKIYHYAQKEGLLPQGDRSFVDPCEVCRVLTSSQEIMRRLIPLIRDWAARNQSMSSSNHVAITSKDVPR